ncbi:MAG: 16S rRNA (guanine(527)-N(7))-methyltransferase RsmG [Treponema sp.]|nr:16S rRNA (guanine(527)-N(7))-methyltransferase RsmG [Treponema sp.]
MEDKLASGLEKLGLPVSETQISRLRQYVSMVLEFNKGYNLMKAADEDEMAASHILDSLAPLEHIKRLAENSPSSPPVLADIGSGGGCPGIPLAIMMDTFQFTLVERMEKRSAFLDSVRTKLELENVTVLTSQAEKVAPKSFDVVIFRAFHPFDQKITRILLSLVKDGGYIASYKARSQKIAVEMDSVKNLIPVYEKIPLAVPFLEDHERNLVVVRKL